MDKKNVNQNCHMSNALIDHLQGSFSEWAQSMRADITIERRLSLAEPLRRMIRDLIGSVYVKCGTHADKWKSPINKIFGERNCKLLI